MLGSLTFLSLFPNWFIKFKNMRSDPLCNHILLTIFFSVGCLGCVPSDESIVIPPLGSRIALISGTSTCHMAVSGILAH